VLQRRSRGPLVLAAVAALLVPSCAGGDGDPAAQPDRSVPSSSVAPDTEVAAGPVPAAAPGPTVTLTPRSGAVVVAWGAPGAEGVHVERAGVDVAGVASWSGTRAGEAGSLTLPGLVDGRPYTVSVTAVSGGVPTGRSVQRTVVPVGDERPPGFSPSGQAMPDHPVAAGGVTWLPVHADDFVVDAAAGREFTRIYGDTFHAYTDGSGEGRYRRDNVSVSGSVLEIRVGERDGVDSGAAGALFEWGLEGPLRTAIRLRADTSIPGYGAAVQLWPTSDVWSEGELNFPEGDFSGSLNLYHHRVGSQPEVNHLAVEGLASWDAWHTAVVEWWPGRSVDYYLDGRLVGSVTEPAQVPTEPHNWVLQAASVYDLPAGGSGRLQVDWAVVWRPA
jgi:hypothetical protein